VYVPVIEPFSPAPEGLDEHERMGSEESKARQRRRIPRHYDAIWPSSRRRRGYAQRIREVSYGCVMAAFHGISRAANAWAPLSLVGISPMKR